MDGEFLVGPMKLGCKPAVLGAGGYCVLSLGEEKAEITTDDAGLLKIYYSESTVTNRPYLAMLVREGLDELSVASQYISNRMFNYQIATFETPVQGFKLLPVGHSVYVEKGGVKERNIEDFSGVYGIDYREYWSLIKKGAEDIVRNVKACVDSGFPVLADLSGGKDSRMIYSALVALGYQDKVLLHTIRRSEKAKDQLVATELVSRFGGRFGRLDLQENSSPESLSRVWKRRRSHTFGFCHDLSNGSLSTAGVKQENHIRLLGGGGELYRGYYYKSFDASEFYEEYSGGKLLRSIEARLASNLLEYSLEGVFERYLSTFDKLEGESFQDKLDNHYLNFRNRYHFGVKVPRKGKGFSISPAFSRNLLRAARSLPLDDRLNGKVVFDTIRILSEEMAYIPFEKHWDISGFKQSRFHKPSMFDNKEYILTGDSSLLKRPKYAERRRKRMVESSRLNRVQFSYAVCRSALFFFENLPSNLLDELGIDFSYIKVRVWKDFSADRRSIHMWASRLQGLRDQIVVSGC